jgi:hypothetical protein
MKLVNSTLGATRNCPHCKTTILQRSTICPACRHTLRFDGGKAGAAKPALAPAGEPLRLEATLRQPEEGGGCEYCLVLTVTNDRGEELTRQVISVGTLKPAEARTFSVWVEAYMPETAVNGRVLQEPALG